MPDDLDNLCLPAGAYLTVQTLDQINATTKQLPSPALITYAMIPEIGSSKWRMVFYGVAHETVGCVGIHAEQERNEQMMRVPERFE